MLMHKNRLNKFAGRATCGLSTSTFIKHVIANLMKLLHFYNMFNETSYIHSFNKGPVVAPSAGRPWGTLCGHTPSHLQLLGHVSSSLSSASRRHSNRGRRPSTANEGDEGSGTGACDKCDGVCSQRALPIHPVTARCFQSAQHSAARRGRAEPCCRNMCCCIVCANYFYNRVRDSDTSWAWMSRWSDDDG